MTHLSQQLPPVTLPIATVAIVVRSATTVLLLLCLLISPRPLRADNHIIYVNDDAQGTGDGASWPNAFTSLQSALLSAGDDKEIWVAAGIYYPDEGTSQVNNSPQSTFSLKNKVALYGGFAGTENSRNQRNVAANITVLSGDLEKNDTNRSATGVISDPANIVGTNAYHVVTSQDNSATAILDGFTITGGNATNGPAQACAVDSLDCGGGMINSHSSPTLANLIFSGNNAATRGGGMYNYFSAPALNTATFSGNKTVGEGGGGMYNEDSSNASLTNVTFSNNEANAGGGIINQNSNLSLTDVTFSDNRATYGAGMYNISSSPSLNTVTFSGNEAAVNGGGMYNFNSSHPSIQNSILWNNTPNDLVNAPGSTPSFHHSLVQGINPPGSGNLDGTNPANNPLFVRVVNCGSDGCADNPNTAGDESENDDYGDLRLQAGSPTIDVGDNTADFDAGGSGSQTIADIATDLAGQPRIAAVKSLPAIVDMGAYETVAFPPSAHTGGPYTSNEGSSLALNGAASNDDVAIISYAWDCTDDGTVDVTAPTPTGSACTYPDDGSYTLRLTLTDNVGVTGTATTQVTVVNVAPVYTPAPNQSTFAGSDTAFDLGTFTDPGAEGAWPITIKWGDGETSTFNATSAGVLPSKSHTYAKVGTYNVVITVDDGEASHQGGLQVVVNDPLVGIVTGIVFADTNGNGTQEQGEEGVPGVDLTLETAVEGNVAVVALIFTTTTDANGRYRFNNVPPDNYTLTINPPVGYTMIGTSEVAVLVLASQITTVPTFALQPDATGGDGSTLHLPALKRQ